MKLQQGVPTKAMAQVFHIFPRPGKKKHCLLAGSFCNLTGRQYLFQLPLSFLWLVKAQDFSCCKASGISKSATSWHKHAPYWNRTLANFAKRPAWQQEPSVYLEPKWLQCQPSAFKRCSQDPIAAHAINSISEKIFIERTPYAMKLQQGVPTKAMAQVFHMFPGPGKKKHCLLAGSFCPLTGRQYLFQLPVSFLWLVKAQGFSCCKASGISKSATSLTQTCALLESNLGQFCKKACFTGRA